jgi:hypothetical protein
MNPNSISHRLFIAALKPGEQTPGKRPSAARSGGPNGDLKVNEPKPVSAFCALASRPAADWSWSGWQQNTI